MLYLSAFPDLTFQSAANEPAGTAPQILASRRLVRGWEGRNWLGRIKPASQAKSAVRADVPGVVYRNIAAHRGSVRGLEVGEVLTSVRMLCLSRSSRDSRERGGWSERQGGEKHSQLMET